jgi:hypothetical protein
MITMERNGKGIFYYMYDTWRIDTAMDVVVCAIRGKI